METTQEKMKTQEEFINETLEKLKGNDFTIHFYCPALSSPSGGIGVLLKQARLLKDSGRNVKLVYEPQVNQKLSYEQSVKNKKETRVFDRVNFSWANIKLDDIELSPLGEGEMLFSDGTVHQGTPLVLKAEDFFIIPEGFPNIMQKTMQVPAKRIVLAQSWFYVLNGMQPGEKWQNFGIKDVISVSDAITEYLNSIMPGLEIKNYSQSIDTNLFSRPKNLSDKNPVIVFTANRGYENKIKIHNIIKTFFAFYPQYKWLRFDELSGLSKEEFADRVKSASLALYADDIAGFGTFPLECMAAGTHVVGWASFGGKEYMNKDNGFWANNGDIFQLAELLGIAVDRWLKGELDNPSVYESYDKTLSQYTVENEKQQVINLYEQYVNARINEIESIKGK